MSYTPVSGSAAILFEGMVADDDPLECRGLALDRTRTSSGERILLVDFSISARFGGALVLTTLFVIRGWMGRIRGCKGGDFPETLKRCSSSSAM